MNQAVHYVVFLMGGLVLALLLAHLLDPQQHSYEAPMTVSEKLTQLQNSVNNVTALVHDQNRQIAEQTTLITSLQSQLAASQADAATLQTQIDALNALVPAPASN